MTDEEIIKDVAAVLIEERDRLLQASAMFRSEAARCKREIKRTEQRLTHHRAMAALAESFGFSPRSRQKGIEV